VAQAQNEEDVMAITQEQRAKLAAGLMRMLELQEKQATLVRAAISLLTQAEWHPAVRANQNQSLTTSGRSHPAAPLRECRKKLAQFRRPPADEHPEIDTRGPLAPNDKKRSSAPGLFLHTPNRATFAPSKVPARA
jgi:hypothetical protein